MEVFKGYVCNMPHLEGSMAEGYILNDIMGFVTEFYKNFNMNLKEFRMQKRKKEWMERY